MATSLASKAKANPSALTLSRRAVRDAVLNWSPLMDAGKSLFTTVWDFEDDTNDIVASVEEAGIAIRDLPTLQIHTTSTPVTWIETSRQEWNPAVVVTAWTPDWFLPVAEFVGENIVFAAYHAILPGESVPVVRKVTKNCLQGVGSISHERVLVGSEGELKAYRTTVAINLRLKLNPFKDRE